MNRKYILLTGLIAISFGFSSCDNFLDKLPDNRTELTENNVSDLLLSAYPRTVPLEINEMYSDNTDEFPKRFSEFNRLQEDLFKWNDSSQKEEDSPYNLWEDCYKSIAVCNQVLNVIENSSDPEMYNAEKGEALVCRAFNHFLLVTTFCNVYSKNADSDLGIPYMTGIETSVLPKYDRGNLSTTYSNIEKDLLEALPLIDDSKYKVSKYHFTKNAAYAFASRFYLNYIKEDKSNLDKVVYYSNYVLGTNPSVLLRDWEALGEKSANGHTRPDAYVDATNSANLLLICANSYWGFIAYPYGTGERYFHGPQVATETIYSRGPWGSGYYLDDWSNSSALPTKIIAMKIAPYNEDVDVVAGTVNGHIINAAFTTDELLLERAEAYALKGMYNEAITDLNYWQKSYTNSIVTLTADLINSFYGKAVYDENNKLISGMDYYQPLKPTVKKELHPEIAFMDDTQENIIHCILHARRVMTLHEGLRWLDIKRYGITVYRRFIKDNGTAVVTDSMKVGDPRYAVQLPSEVILAGMKSNPRNK